MNLEKILLDLNYLTYAVNFLTIITSILSLVIFSRKVFSRSTIGLYCRCLAVFDFSVIFNFTVGITAIAMNTRSLIPKVEWICKMSNFVLTAFSSNSGWILVFFSLDQLINVSMTKRFPFYKKKWFQIALIIGLIIVHLGMYTPNIVLSELQTVMLDANTTTTNCGINSIAFPIVLLIESSVLPLITLLILTGLIVRYLAQSRNRTFNEFSHTMSSANGLVNKRRKDFKYAFNSVILNIMHILLSAPLLIFTTLPTTDYGFYQLLTTIGYFLSLLNQCLHFWVHFCVNSFFRNEVLILFRIRRR